MSSSSALASSSRSAASLSAAAWSFLSAVLCAAVAVSTLSDCSWIACARRTFAIWTSYAAPVRALSSSDPAAPSADCFSPRSFATSREFSAEIVALCAEASFSYDAARAVIAFAALSASETVFERLSFIRSISAARALASFSPMDCFRELANFSAASDAAVARLEKYSNATDAPVISAPIGPRVAREPRMLPSPLAALPSADSALPPNVEIAADAPLIAPPTPRESFATDPNAALAFAEMLSTNLPVSVSSMLFAAITRRPPSPWP